MDQITQEQSQLIEYSRALKTTLDIVILQYVPESERSNYAVPPPGSSYLLHQIQQEGIKNLISRILYLEDNQTAPSNDLKLQVYLAKIKKLQKQLLAINKDFVLDQSLSSTIMLDTQNTEQLNVTQVEQTIDLISQVTQTDQEIKLKSPQPMQNNIDQQLILSPQQLPSYTVYPQKQQYIKKLELENLSLIEQNKQLKKLLDDQFELIESQK